MDKKLFINLCLLPIKGIFIILLACLGILILGIYLHTPFIFSGYGDVLVSWGYPEWFSGLVAFGIPLLWLGMAVATNFVEKKVQDIFVATSAVCWVLLQLSLIFTSIGQAYWKTFTGS